MIGLVDYGGGNLASVLRALQRASGGQAQRVSTPEDLLAADRIVFPGQGAMADCMARLESSGLKAPLLEALRCRPFLGICVGMQMLFERSEEADTPGLGVFPGEVLRLTAARGAVDAEGRPLKVPHMGWNEIQCRRSHPVLAGLDAMPLGHWFYFVHSYAAQPNNPALILAETHYGSAFTCAVAADNIVATQFHPEKSAEAGLRLLENFVHWAP